MAEPTITLNGVTLSPAQAMTMRVALQDFLMSLSAQDALGDDEHGHAMRGGYLARGREINAIMHPTTGSAG